MIFAQYLILILLLLLKQWICENWIEKVYAIYINGGMTVKKKNHLTMIYFIYVLDHFYDDFASDLSGKQTHSTSFFHKDKDIPL